MSIRTEMPLLARHDGEWEGEYVVVDAEGNVTDRHRSYLECRFPEGEPGVDYHQTNTYTWADGTQEVHRFPARYADGAIWFDTERIKGHAWEVDDRCVVLTWVYQGREQLHLYELIHLSEDGNHRARVWQWFRDDELFQRTLIKEVRT